MNCHGGGGGRFAASSFFVLSSCPERKAFAPPPVIIERVIPHPLVREKKSKQGCTGIRRRTRSRKRGARFALARRQTADMAVRLLIPEN